MKSVMITVDSRFDLAITSKNLEMIGVEITGRLENLSGVLLGLTDQDLPELEKVAGVLFVEEIIPLGS